MQDLNQNRNDSAIKNFEYALETYNQAESGEGVYTSGIYLAIALKKAGRLEDFLKYDRIFRSYPIDSDSLSAQLKLSLGAAFFEKGDYEEALDNLEFAQNRLANSQHNDLLQFRILENIAKLYKKIEDATAELKHTMKLKSSSGLRRYSSWRKISWN